MTPTYHVNIGYTIPGSTSEKNLQWREAEFSAPFSQWFTADGSFVVKLFQNWLASNTSKICINSGNFLNESNKKGYGVSKATSESEIPSSIGYISGSTARSRRKG